MDPSNFDTGILSSLGDYGVMGAIVAFLLWQSSKTQNTLLNIIKDNTEALTELREIIKKSLSKKNN